MSKRIAVVGGGPGGLFFAILMKRRRPDWQITLFERNRATDAFGFGVVFSAATLEKIATADPLLDDLLEDRGAKWSEIDVHLKGEVITFDGNDMSAIHRRVLLTALQEEARDTGVELCFSSEVSSPVDLPDHDVIVAADGANSAFREHIGAEALGHSVVEARAKFIWFGTDRIFPGLTFLHRRSEHGNFAVHAYPISDTVSTFIVETDEETWRAAGLDEFDVTQPPGPSDVKTAQYVAALFAPELQGGRILTNNSRWANFHTRATATWHSGNVALIGDAVHTAHFSVGSGTKMAMEDAIALADGLDAHPEDVQAAFAEYERLAQGPVAAVQNAAGPSLRWWEHFGEYCDAFEPWQFGFHFFSRAIGLAKIAKRDQAFADASVAGWVSQYGTAVLDTPFVVAGHTVVTRRLKRAADGGIIDGSGTRLPSGARMVDLDEGPWFLVSGSQYVVVAGGDDQQRIGVAELQRLRGDVPVILDLPGADEDLVTTLVLSGRADAVIA